MKKPSARSPFACLSRQPLRALAAAFLLVVALTTAAAAESTPTMVGSRLKPLVDDPLFVHSSLSAPSVLPLAACRMGDAKVTVNAKVLTDGKPGSYWVEYGESPAYGRRTAPRPLPPLHGAHVSETWNRSTAGWVGGLSGKDLLHREPDTTPGFISYAGPTDQFNRSFPGNPPGCDVNHVDGIGTLHLSTYTYIATMGSMNLNLGGGYPDLRDAIVNLDIRGKGYESAGSELVFWAQADNDRSLQNTATWRRANWAYTAKPLSTHLKSGQWEQVVLSLDNDANKWSYGGNNRSQTRYERYDYNSLNDSLADVSCNIFFLQAFVSPENPPRGEIDFRNLSISYRNHSLLFPAHGTKLISCPTDSRSSAVALTDGWRNGEGRMWQSAAAPVYPQDFVWKLPTRAELRSLQIHQNPDFPAREVEVLGSEDSEHWVTLARVELQAGSKISANHAYSMIELGQSRCQYLKLRVLSGYEQEACGLGEVELFGKGVEMATNRGWNHLNVDIDTNGSGASQHYRFAVKTTDGVVYGPDCIVFPPTDNRPLVENVRIIREHDEEMTLQARVTPMGARTTAMVETRNDAGWQRCTEPLYVGLQNTPRDVLVHFKSPSSKGGAEYRMVATNEHGAASANASR